MEWIRYMSMKIIYKIISFIDYLGKYSISPVTNHFEKNPFIDYFWKYQNKITNIGDKKSQCK